MAEVRVSAEEWMELQQRIEGLEYELANQCYRGNSISYIYDKMTCYRDKVGMAFDALRALGFDPSTAKDNDHMRGLLKAFVKDR